MRSRRNFAALAATVMMGSAGLIRATAASADPAPRGAAVIQARRGVQDLRLYPDLGLGGRATLWFDSARLAFFGRRLSGGTVRLGGDVTLTTGDETARITELALDIGTGTVNATLADQPIRLATVDTRTLRLRKEPQDKFLYFDIGVGDDRRIELTENSAAVLGAALGGAVGLGLGTPLLIGVVSSGLFVDAELADQLNVDANALIASGVDVEIPRDERLDLSLYLPRD